MWIYDTQADGPPVEFHGEPLVTDELVIAGSDLREPGGVAHVYAFERTTGKVRWKDPVPIGVASDFARVGSRLFASTLEDRLICLELESGRPLWSFASGSSNEENAFTTSPVADGSRVYYADLKGILHAFEPGSGKEIWRRDLGSRSTASPRLVGGKLYVGTLFMRLFRLDANSGSVEAELPLPDSPVWPIASSGNLLFFFLRDEAIVAVDTALTKIQWSQKGAAAWTSARPYVWRDAVLAGDKEGRVLAFGAKDGALQFSSKFEGMIRGIGSSEDSLYIGTLKGTVYAWSPGGATRGRSPASKETPGAERPSPERRHE